MHYIEVKNVSQIYSVGNEPVNALTNISFAIERPKPVPPISLVLALSTL